LRKLNAILLTFVLVVVLVAGYWVLRLQVAQGVYRSRVLELADAHERLRDLYNEVVKKTAVTELQVDDGKLSVVVVTAAGVSTTIETPYDPKSEIHVDYVVIDGRLWIRRIHDAKTPPEQAMLIDPKLADVAWDGDGRVYGISIYRPLDEGRWVVSVTPNGALTLARRRNGEQVPLVASPQIKDFSQVEHEIADDIADIGIRDVFTELIH